MKLTNLLDQLTNCIYCGNKAMVQHITSGNKHIVRCQRCGTFVEEFTTIGVINSWNRLMIYCTHVRSEQNDRKQKVYNLVKSIKCKVLGHELQVLVLADQIYGERQYIQIVYTDRCHRTGQLKQWKGRKWYLSSYMTDDEIVKTAFAACKTVLEHEVMEGFTVNSKAPFNPHINFEALLRVSDDQVSRNQNGNDE